MELLKLSFKRIKCYFYEEEKLNKSVEVEMLNKNIKRMTYLQLTAIIINIVLILSFSFVFNPTSMFQEKWQAGVITIHAVSAGTVALMTIALIILNKKKNPVTGMKMIQNIFVIYVQAVGLAIIIVDEPRTANIIPFLIVCMILGVFILKKPSDVLIQYLIAYTLFFYVIGINEDDAMALITNRVNGFVFVIIGIFMAIIIWHSERSNILQKRKIQEQQKKLEAAAYYDDLTGLINRRKWVELLHDEFERMKRYDHQSSILLLDIDNFKEINDQYGHPAGDRILKEIAKQLKKELRICDKIGRWGGEEFIVLLTETSISNGKEVGEKLRNKIEKMCIQVEADIIDVTISIGVTGLDHKKDFLMSYKKADQALYLAKNNGRNRVEYVQ